VVQIFQPHTPVQLKALSFRDASHEKKQRGNNMHCLPCAVQNVQMYIKKKAQVWILNDAIQQDWRSAASLFFGFSRDVQNSLWHIRLKTVTFDAPCQPARAIPFLLLVSILVASMIQHPHFPCLYRKGIDLHTNYNTL